MLLGYVDETAGDSCYYVVGLVMTGEGVKELSPALDSIVRQAADDYGVDRLAELHGHDLYQGKAQWKPMARQIRGRIAVYRHALEVIADHCEGFYVRGVHTQRFDRRYGGGFDQHTAVMAFLMEEFDDHCIPQDQLMLCIADECGTQATVRSDLRHFREYGTWGYRGRKIERLLDTFHFVPSHESRLIQAVDLVAFLYQRMNDHTETDQRSERANKELWSIVEPRRLNYRRPWYP